MPEFLLQAKGVQDEKMDTLRELIKDIGDFSPNQFAGINISSGTKSFVTPQGVVEIDAEKFLPVKKRLELYDSGSLAVKAMLDKLGIDAFVVETSFFNHLCSNLGLFRKYKDHGEKMIARRPSELLRLNSELIQLESDKPRKKGFVRRSFGLGMDPHLMDDLIESKKAEIDTFFQRADKTELLREMFPGLSSFALDSSFIDNNKAGIVNLCYEHAANASGSSRRLMLSIGHVAGNRLDIITSKIEEDPSFVAKVLAHYHDWIDLGYVKNFISVELSFPEPPENIKAVIRGYVPKFKELGDEVRVMVVADPEAVGIKPTVGSLNLVEPKQLDPGLALEFTKYGCVAILHRAFYNMQSSEKELLNRAEAVAQAWSPIQSFLLPN